MGFFGDLWSGLVRAEHQLERALGLHPAPDGPIDVVNAAAFGASSGGTSAVSSGPRMALTPKPGNPITAARIKRTGELLSRYWPELSGESGAMPPQALELALAQSGLESVYGGGWTDKTAKGQGDMRGSFNLGGRQCGAQGAGPSWRCVPYGDTRPPTAAEVAAGQTANIPIPASFRYFTAGEGRTAEENGAYYFLRDLIKTWPVKEQLLSGDAGAYAHRLGPDKAHGGLGYYGGFGTTFAEREGGYVKALASRLPEVAAALGHDRVVASVPAVSAGGVHAAASDARIAGIGDDAQAWLAELGRALVRGEHEVERWIFGPRDVSPLAAALESEPHGATAQGVASSGGTSSGGTSPAGLSDRRKKALDIVSEVVPSRYPDARFKRLAPGFRVDGGNLFDGANALPEHFTTCGYLPGFVGSQLGLAKNLSSYGTEGLRTNGKAWNAWVVPGDGRMPKPGDAYAIAGAGGGIVHVGVFVGRNPDGSWHTADAGQGPREAQEARYVDRPYDPKAQTLGGPLGPRPLAGWVDLDAVPHAADARIAGIGTAPRALQVGDRVRWKQRDPVACVAAPCDRTPGTVVKITEAPPGELRGGFTVGRSGLVVSVEHDHPPPYSAQDWPAESLELEPDLGTIVRVEPTYATNLWRVTLDNGEVRQMMRVRRPAIGDPFTAADERVRPKGPDALPDARIAGIDRGGSVAALAAVFDVTSDPHLGAAVASSALDPIAWWPIHVAGYTIQTTTEPLASGGQRLPMSFGDLVRIARDNRALPITKAVSDARWQQAQNKTTVSPLNDPRGAVFNDPKQIAAYSARVGPIGSVLRDGGWKEMVLSANLKPKGPGSMLFYGWRLPNGTPIQKGIKSDHDRAWIEYDQFGTLMQRDAIDPRGNKVDLLDVLARGGSPLMDGKLPAFLVTELGGAGVGA